MKQGLNEKQLEAVTYPYQGPILILAGAGTGKTTVLINRIEFLIKELNYDPKKILAITFTNKAASEIKARLKKQSMNLLWAGTFHSICVRILRKNINYINRKKDFRILDVDDQKKIIKDILNELGFDPKDTPAILKVLSEIKRKNTNIGFNKNVFNQYSEKEKYNDDLHINRSKYEKVIQRYEEFNASNNYLDFDDLLNYTVYLLKSNSEIKKYWSEYFEYILIDEFQDTNDVQYELLLQLCNEDKNIFAVGDGDQTIYSFRGSNPEIITKFVYLMGSEKPIILDQNYRSTQSILDISNSLIKHNKDRIKKSLVSNSGTGNKPILYSAHNNSTEAKWVTLKIKELLSNDVDPNEIVILLRSNYLSMEFEDALLDENIDYKLIGGVKFFQRKEVKDLISYLRVIIEPDDLSIDRIINVPTRKIGSNTQSTLRQFAEMNNISYFDAIVRCEETALNSGTKNLIKQFLDLINYFRNAKHETLIDLVDDIIKQTGYIEYRKKEEKDVFKVNDIVSNIESLKIKLSSIKPEPNQTLFDALNNFLQDASLLTGMDEEIENDKPLVSIMTIHNSKGLEFDYVFLPCFNDDVLPSSLCITDKEVQEERRVAYVAITRARKQLYVSYHSNRFNYFQTLEEKSKSRFIENIGIELFEKYKPVQKRVSSFKDNWFDSQQTDTFKKLTVDNYSKDQPNLFKVGEYVSHTKFGNGSVIKVEDEYITINFKNAGEKKLKYNHTAIKRVFE